MFASIPLISFLPSVSSQPAELKRASKLEPKSKEANAKEPNDEELVDQSETQSIDTDWSDSESNRDMEGEMKIPAQKEGLKRIKDNHGMVSNASQRNLYQYFGV